MNWYLQVLQKYAVFSGRARRMEYWMFVLSNTKKISSTIAPINGTNPIRHHQPVRSVSCKRRTPTAIDGMIIARA